MSLLDYQHISHCTRVRHRISYPSVAPRLIRSPPLELDEVVPSLVADELDVQSIKSV